MDLPCKNRWSVAQQKYPNKCFHHLMEYNDKRIPVSTSKGYSRRFQKKGSLEVKSFTFPQAEL